MSTVSVSGTRPNARSVDPPEHCALNGREASRRRFWALHGVGEEGRKITFLRGPCGRRTLGLCLLALGLQIACGGQAVVEDDGGTGGDASTGGAGPTGGSGGESATGGGPLASGGVAGTGGVGDNGCSRDTIECLTGYCTCEGVFEDCSSIAVHCDADADGEPYNCVCGAPLVGVSDCEYGLQYRCEPPGAIAWLSTCTCDPVLPTDAEPCRYYQAMYDALGEDRTCIMAVTDIEPMEKSKYQCSCLPNR